MLINDILNYQIYSGKTFTLTAGHLVEFLVLLIVGILISKLLKHLIGKRIAKSLKVSRHQAITIQKVIYYICIVVSIYIALSALDIPLSTITFLVGGIGIGVGLGLQHYFNNVWSGIVLLIEKPFKMGDVVEVKGIIGRIWDINFRSFRIHTEENIDIIMPNSVVLEEGLINWTKDDQKVLSSVRIGIGYESDIDFATQIMIGAASGVPGVIADPSPFVLFREHGNSSLIFEVFFNVKITNKLERWQFESQVNYALNRALRKNNIEIPFPKLDIAIKPTSVEKAAL